MTVQQRVMTRKSKLIITCILALLAMPVLLVAPTRVAHALPGFTCGSYSTVSSTDLAAWDKSETRVTGHNELTTGGLHIWTEGASTTDKAAGYYAATFPLASIGVETIAQAIDYTATTGPAPGLQLKVDFDDDGTTDGTLVGEAVYGNNWWLTGSASQFAKDGAPHNGGGNGSQWYGTTDEWSAAFPAAKVKAIGYSLGSGVHGDGVIKRITLGCVNYTFDKLLPDVLPPSVPTGGAPNNVYKTTNDFTFTWNASSDDRGGVITYEFRSSQDEAKVGDAPDSSGAWMSGPLHDPSIHSTGAPDGIWYWQVRAMDGAGNKSAWSDVWKMAIDTTKPILDVSEPATSEPFNGTDKKTITVHAFLQDDQGLSQYHIDVDGVDTTTQNSDVHSDTFSGAASLTVITIFNAPDFSDGMHTINMRVTDKAGNSTIESRTVLIDTKRPVVSTNIEEDQSVDGVVPIALYTDEAHPQTYSIRVLSADRTAVAGAYDPNNGTNTFVYDWNSATSPNGIYTVELTAKDAAGNETTITRTVRVNNRVSEPQPQPPTATIEPGVDGRTIYGTVSDPDATFTVKIDGLARSDVVVRVGDKVDGGYLWYFELPSGIASGVEHTLEVVAHVGGLDSDAAASTFYIEPGGGTTLAPVGSDPLLEQLSAALTQPFDVPGSLTSPSLVPASIGPETDSDKAILGAQTIKDPSGGDARSVPVTASKDGWRLFGLSWYWWLLAVGIAGGGVAWMTARIRQRAGAMDI